MIDVSLVSREVLGDHCQQSNASSPSRKWHMTHVTCSAVSQNLLSPEVLVPSPNPLLHYGPRNEKNVAVLHRQDVEMLS